MLFNSALVASLLAAGHVAAFKGAQVNALLQRSQDVEEVLRRDAGIMASLTRRQDANAADTAPLASLTPASGNAAGADLANWDAKTKAACMSTLSKLNGQASNPSGIAVCYNLPFLDNSTGVFQAELRMYNVSAPVDPWVGVTAADVSMTLSYLGATVQNMNGNFTKRDLSGSVTEGMLVGRQDINTMTEMKVLMYVGRINSNLMGPAMDQKALQNLLIPEIDLSARNPVSGKDVETTLSSTEASFVNGIFSKAGTAPTNADPAAAASASAAVVSAAPFVVPGTEIREVFPLGLIITGIWTFFFFLAVGLGTFGRIQFRDQYRRRVKQEMARGVNTI